ncbi:hypothetical protein EJ08DRAFT_627315 [Tothia fuscella]|uniref:Uncharacterized protein n=1 Tax=Tothia fuscella TaxID=1048955 RepID=A0A9P4NZC8_9PEZI|nr:hypothetical protein EJ08DRAFT_627315 [Tothia fuscella]
MSNVNETSPHVPDQLVEQLVKGYDALSAEIKLLDEQRRELENKVSWSKQQYLDALKRFSPENASQDFRVFLDELDEAGACKQEREVDWLESLRRSTDSTRKSRAFNIHNADDAREKLKYRQSSSDAEHAVRIWNGRSADSTDQGVEMERDFTTPGTPGRLKCPYVPRGKTVAIKPPSTTDNHRGMSTPRSSMSRISLSGKRSKRSSFHDPIRAEICGQPVPSAPPSIEGSVPLCPIRFMDQHSPEEVAQYFEKHKHELPRSHEICVKRYQTNEASIRRLDSKYGNLINMIQGLGAKHQPMLPEVDDDVAVEDDPDGHTSKDRVHSWAKAVSVSLDNDEPEPIDSPKEDERMSRFDRPLKDVRVGESPSRPWGIQVPPRYTDDLDAASTKSDPTASPLDTPDLQQGEQPGKPKCPFHNGTVVTVTFQAPVEQPMMLPHPGPPPLPPPPPPPPEFTAPFPPPAHIFKGPFTGPVLMSERMQGNYMNITGPFHGPVLIGYTAEEAVVLLRGTRWPMPKASMGEE